MTLHKPTPLPKLTTASIWNFGREAAATPKPHNRNTLNDLLDLDTLRQHNDAINTAISYMFFLPYDVLHNENFLVLPVFLLSGSKLDEFAQIMADDDHCVFELPYEILQLGKTVGISMRYNKTTRKWHVIMKLWYGNATNTRAVPTTVPEIAKEMAYQLALVKQNTP